MRKSLLFMLLLSTLVACSGGGAGGDSSNGGGGSGGGGGGGGGSTTSPTATVSSVTISGISQLGPIKNAFVQARPIDELGKVIEDEFCSDPIRTEDDGSFDLKLYEDCVGLDIIIETLGGTYTDEATGETESLALDEGLKALVPEATQENMDLQNENGGIGVTPLTEMATERALATIQPGMKLKDVTTTVREEMEEVFGVDPYTAPVPPDADISGASNDDKRVKAMAVIAGFSQAAKDTCEGNCDQLSMIKTMAIDYKDGKSDGKVGTKPIDELDDSALQNLGVNSNSVSKIKEKFKESRDALESSEVVTNSFIGKIKAGVEKYASEKNTNLNNFVPEVKMEAEIAKAEKVFKVDERFQGKYFEERDKFNEKYSPVKDPRSAQYIPAIDPNLLKELYNPDKDPCNENGAYYDVNKDPCKKADEMKDVFLIGLDLTEDQQASFDNVFDQAFDMIKDNLANLKSIENDENKTFDFSQTDFFKRDDVKEEIVQVENDVKNSFGDFDTYRDFAKKGFDLSDIKASENELPQGANLDGLWTQNCFSTVLDNDQRVFIKEILKIDFGFIQIETHYFKDQQCIFPNNKIDPHFATGKLSVDVPEAGKLTFTGKEKVFECIDPTTGDVAGESVDEACGPNQYFGKLIRTDILDPEVIPYDLTNDVLTVTLEDGDHIFTRDAETDIFAYNEEKEAEEFISENEEFKDYMEDDLIYEEYFDPEYVQTRMFFFESSGTDHNYSGKFKRVTIRYEDEGCKVVKKKRVIFGNYSTTQFDPPVGDAEEGDINLNLTDRFDYSDPKNPTQLPDYFTKMLVFTDVSPDEAILGDNLGGTRGKNAEQRADFFNFDRRENVFRRANISTKTAIDASEEDFTSANSSAEDDAGNLTGAWSSKCVPSYAGIREQLADNGGDIKDYIDPNAGFDDQFIGEFGDFIKNDYIEEFYGDGGEIDPNFQDYYKEQGPQIDFSNEDKYLAKGDGAGDFASGKNEYNDTGLADSSSVLDFDGVWVGNCENGVAVLSISGVTETDGVGYAKVRMDCEGLNQVGKAKIIPTQSTGFFNIDVKFEFSEIHQIAAVLDDGRIAFGKGDCFENGCFRPSKESIFPGNTDGTGDFIGDAFYPVSNLATASIDSTTPGQQWLSACVPNDGGHAYKKMTISFINNETFNYSQKLFVDDECIEEVAIQDDESEASGTWYIVPDFFTTHNGDEFQVSSKLFLTSNLELGSPDSCVYDWETKEYFCETGTIAIINNELFLDNSDHDETSYYDQYYTDDIYDDYIDDFENWAPEIGEEWFVRTTSTREDIASFEASDISTFDFNSLPSKYFGPCEFGDGVYEFSISGINPVNANVKVTCDGMITTATNVIVDTTSDNTKISLIGGENTTVSHEENNVTWEGDSKSIYWTISLDTTTKIIMDEDYYEYLTPVADADTNTGTPLIEGSYLSSCMLDFESGKFFREKITIANATISSSIDASLGFSKILYHDPECDGFDTVAFQLKNINANFTYATDKVMMTLSGTHSDPIGEKADDCVDNGGTFTCPLGQFVLHENALIPMKSAYDEYYEENYYDENYYDEAYNQHYDENAPPPIDILVRSQTLVAVDGHAHETLDPNDLTSLASNFNGTYAGPCDLGFGTYTFSFASSTVGLTFNCEGDVQTIESMPMQVDSNDSSILNIDSDFGTLPLTFDSVSGTIKFADTNELLLPVVAFDSLDSSDVPVLNGTFNGSCQFDFQTGRFISKKITILDSTPNSGSIDAKISIERKVYKDPECKDFERNDNPSRDISATFQYMDPDTKLMAELKLPINTNIQGNRCEPNGNNQYSYSCHRNGHPWSEWCYDSGSGIYSCVVDSFLLNKNAIIPMPKEPLYYPEPL